MNSPLVQHRQPIEARYLPSPVQEFRGNPLVEALPAIKSDDEWIEQMLMVPAFDASQLEDDAFLRSYSAAASLKDVFIPDSNQLHLARRVDQLLRSGYRKRNPLTPERATTLQQTYEKAQTSSKTAKIVFDEQRPICSFSVMGMSGMGKSTSVQAVLGAYPQCIHHPAHNLFQVVWLKVDCPKDGSVRELAMTILRAFDRVLGTRHALTSSSRATAASLTSKVSHLAMTYCLGVLVLDELQNLSVKKSGGREEMLNWFQELVNELCLPVLLLGTFKARSVLQLDVRHSRRNAIMGSASWHPMSMDDDFRLLLENLWEYQWLRSPGPLNEEMVRAIYEETQGVKAFIVDMFLVAQLYALRTNQETLTPAMFKEVARKEFQPLQPFLNALRSGQLERMRKFEDASSYDIDELIEQQQRLITRGPGQLAILPKEASLPARAAANLRALGISSERARELVAKVNDGSRLTVSALTRAAFELHNDDDLAEPAGEPVAAEA